METRLDRVMQAREAADRLYTRDEVAAVIERVAVEVSTAIGGSDPVCLAVPNGGSWFAERLLAQLAFPLQQDYIHASRYRGKTRGGKLQWLAKPRVSIRGKTVLIIDDILDEGVTLAGLLKWCRRNGASNVFSAVLVRKQHDRCVHEVEADFVGLEVPDHYVFGCGMDYRGYWRQLPEIYALPAGEA